MAKLKKKKRTTRPLDRDWLETYAEDAVREAGLIDPNKVVDLAELALALLDATEPKGR